MFSLKKKQEITQMYFVGRLEETAQELDFAVRVWLEYFPIGQKQGNLVTVVYVGKSEKL